MRNWERRAECGKLRAEFGELRAECGELRAEFGEWRVESGAEGTRLPPLQGEGDRRAVEGFSNEELGMRN